MSRQGEWRECRTCRAPAVVVNVSPLNGIDFNGEDAIFSMELIECATGHRYNSLNEDDTIRLEEE